MTLEEYKECRKSLDIFKCSKCGYEEAGIYQYVISGHTVWQYPLSCPACDRSMLGVETDCTDIVLGLDLAAKESKDDKA